MHINLETPDNYAIEAYDATHVKINAVIYQHSLLVSRDGVIADWPVDRHTPLTLEQLARLIATLPEIIIMSHPTSYALSPLITADLANRGIGLECMSLGAACRTYNVLLNENRRVILALIF